VDDRHAAHRLDWRKQLDDVGGGGLLDRERPDGSAPQVAQVGTAAEEVPEVGGEGADVRATGARDVDRQHARVGCGSDVEALDRDRAGRPLDLDARTGELVEPAPVNVDRRDHRRHLFDVAEEVGGDDPPGLLDGHAGHVVRGDDGAIGVEGVGLDAEHDLARVALVTVADEAHQPGHRADADDEHTGGARVERPGVADAALAEAPAQHADDVVAGDAGRFVDDGQPVDGRRAAPGHYSGRSARSLRSARMMSSMRAAERITSSGRNTSTGVFFVRIWRLIDDWMRRRCCSSTSSSVASLSSPSR
jgi:hypothetical protein